MSLLDQINHAEKTRREIARRLAEQDEMIAVLKSYRFECKHEFSKPWPGYEHEGGQCVHCGINEVYWACNKPKETV